MTFFCVPALRPSQQFFSNVKKWVEQVYAASKVKHDMNITSEMVIVLDFLQKNNQILITIVTQVFPWTVKPIRMPFYMFA